MMREALAEGATQAIAALPPEHREAIFATVLDEILGPEHANRLVFKAKAWRHSVAEVLQLAVQYLPTPDAVELRDATWKRLRELFSAIRAKYPGDAASWKLNEIAKDCEKADEASNVVKVRVGES